MILNYFSGQHERPNRVDSKKDKDYHIRYAKHCLGSIDSNNYQKFLDKYDLNKKFYAGKQWEVDEDLEAFLKDETGMNKNRIKIVQNTIRPLIEQYKGNGNRMVLDWELNEVSPRTITRREKILSEKIMMFVASKLLGKFGEGIKRKHGLGDTVEETADIFQNMYVDEVKTGVNKIINYLQTKNNLDKKKMLVAEHIGLSGLGVLRVEKRGGELDVRVVFPDDFFWDTSAQMPDLSDADYMGEFSYENTSDVVESWMLDENEASVIENFTQTIRQNATQDNYNNDYLFTGAKVPTARVYWKDYDYKKFGYVMSDLADVPVLKRIYDSKEDGEYTEDDLVDVPKESNIKDKFRGDNKFCKIPVEVIRYCEFIPREVMAGIANKNGSRKKPEDFEDIVGDFGALEYQEDDITNPQYSKYPFKCYTWGYQDGEILSPVDDAISPQRFLNRVLSATEAQINNAGGAGIVIDEDAVPAQDGPSEVHRNISQGKPVTVQTKGMGVQNVISKYDATPSQGTYKQFELIPMMNNMIKDVTGVNDALQGQGMGQDQLVGVTQALIQRGSLMQEPFYFAIEQIFEQIFQSFATIGRDVLIDNKDKLVIAAGNRHAEVVQLSKDWKKEDFRLFLKRTQPEEQQHQIADQMLLQFIQMGLIDEKDFANLYGRSTPSEIAKAVREHAIAKEIEAKQQAAMQKQEAQQEQQMMGEALKMAQQKEANDKIMNRQNEYNEREHEKELQNEKLQGEIDKVMAKEIAQNIQGNNKNEEKQDFKL